MRVRCWGSGRTRALAVAGIIGVLALAGTAGCSSPGGGHSAAKTGSPVANVALAQQAAASGPAGTTSSAGTASSAAAPSPAGTTATGGTGPGAAPRTASPASPAAGAATTPPATTAPAATPSAATASPAGISAAVPARITAVSGPIVALGDSYTSGDLLPVALSTPVGCLRSSAAYPQLVATALHDKNGLVNASCSSAGAADITAAQRTSAGTNPPQLNAVSGSDALVMLTLGGDDLGFLNVLDKCMSLSWSNPFGSPCQHHYDSGGTDQLAALVTAQAPKMAAALAQIHAKAPRARVLLVGYPDIFPRSGGCWPAVPITSGDISYLRGLEVKLNAMLATEARATGTTFVDSYDPTIGHDFCQRASVRDVEGLVPATLTAPFHPNARGQAAIAAQVLRVLAG